MFIYIYFYVMLVDLKYIFFNFGENVYYDDIGEVIN